MKIINVDDIGFLSFTVDTTIISVDNTHITVDMTTGGTSSLFMDIIPSEYPAEAYMDFWNELTQVTTRTSTPTTIFNGKMRIYYSNLGFNDGENYEITVRKTDETIIYRTKAYVTTSDDLQNYRLLTMTNSVIQI
ncbi:hypothetical protein UFOVP639_8 [uncultured Caudovirales phage]|uniref:Uncharacterized protein n=1 Tax=uncultured Caudovirales phage TaxID=2100421 RepID=A0A6J5N436_9CAUD|nr:hypothetical protein UFOVP639_8 [uncultured Caudovirales phage]